MEVILGGLAFLGLIAAQLAAVVAVHNMRKEKDALAHQGAGGQEPAAESTRQGPGGREAPVDLRAKHLWLFAD